jgi:hypothetical protein
VGDWNQAILDHEVTTLEQARRLAADIVTWLIDQGIVEDRQCDGCLGDGACYPPAPQFMRASGGVESNFVNENYASFSTMVTNGLRVAVGRNAILNNQGEFAPGPCPQCGTDVPIDDFWQAGSDWCEGKSDKMQCRHCGQASDLPRWKHPDAGFIMLAFEFWNWPPLSDAFVQAIAKRLGHQITVIAGKC